MGQVGNRRILIAEDEGLIAMQLEDLLSGMGYEVVGPVSTVREVEDCIQKQNFEGALLDVNLRGQAILGVLPQLKDMGIPFIITSGYDAASLFPPQFRDMPRMAKPFDEAALCRLCSTTFK